MIPTTLFFLPNHGMLKGKMLLTLAQWKKYNKARD